MQVAKHVSAENISDMGVSPSNDQIAYLMRGVSPPGMYILYVHVVTPYDLDHGIK